MVVTVRQVAEQFQLVDVCDKHSCQNILLILLAIFTSMPSLSSCWSYKYTGETEVRTKGAVSLPFVLKRSRITLYRQPYGSSAAQMEDMDALAKARFGGLKPKQRLIVKVRGCALEILKFSCCVTKQMCLSRTASEQTADSTDPLSHTLQEKKCFDSADWCVSPPYIGR